MTFLLNFIFYKSIKCVLECLPENYKRQYDIKYEGNHYTNIFLIIRQQKILSKYS